MKYIWPTSNDITNNQWVKPFKQDVQIWWHATHIISHYGYAKHECNLLSTNPYMFQGLMNESKLSHVIINSMKSFIIFQKQ
jgi:hypothetical protein